ncbi:hypothetical protein O181_071150 [Austropuccinia psidii MF-1]|uniref:Uncharacterized protein n=1 Tax=Austropuccinia psidii MF-1 TaxID=1389203 RepID=A0A9Q3EXW8_9BASI|nr:hypothetical protein [Austropuccinia psidii MF-1]
MPTLAHELDSAPLPAAKICFHSHQHTSAITHPYDYAPPPNPLCGLPCLCSCSTRNIWIQSCHPISSLTPAPSSLQLTMLKLPLHPQDMPLTLPPHVCPHPSAPLPLTMLTLPKSPQDMPPTPVPHLCTHPSLCFCTPSTYHVYTPEAPSRNASNAATPFLPSPILMLTHPCLTFSTS